MNVEALVSALAPECSWCSGLRCEFYGSPALSTEEWEVRTPHSWAETLHQLRVPAAGQKGAQRSIHPFHGTGARESLWEAQHQYVLSAEGRKRLPAGLSIHGWGRKKVEVDK